MISTDRYEEYRKTVGSFGRLSPRESSRLAWSAWLGDWTARQELIERSLWLVLDWADEAGVGSSSAQVDLVVEGNRSLARAAETYRPWADGDFTAFARGRLPKAARPSLWESANRLPEVEIAFMGEAAS
jgi:DNA-directed RNA polymerase sigma subunit (sigma70/sigma32)